ncbi:MAG: hypothetical protein ACE5GE_08305 [Phycisphaerae bacterium]
MSSDALGALQVENEFLSGVEANFERAKGRQLRGSSWQTARHDDEPALRAMMARHHRHDRALLKQMPRNRRIAVLGFERRWWFAKRRTGVAVASVLAPLEHLASGAEGAMPPIGLGELTDHVRKLVGDARLPHVIGVCSPSGFSEEARQARLDLPNVTLVLIEPSEGGGWKLSSGQEALAEPLRALFDPEDANQKLARVEQAIEGRMADLLVGGVEADSLAGRLDLPPSIVAQAMQRIAEKDPELRVTRKEGQLLMYRGAPASTQEKASMNVVDRIRALFAKQGDEAEKINILAERRAGLAQRRERIYEDIGKLEEKESRLLDQGKQSTSSVVKRRLASQLAQLRKDIGRQNTTANMLNQQINILSTDIHNLTLIQQGQMAQLPSTEALTENAVQAEEMLETLKADADLVGSLETGLGEVMTSDEELAILQEFEAEAPQETSSKKAAAPAKTPSAESVEPGVVEPPSALPEPEPPSAAPRPADPEAL